MQNVFHIISVAVKTANKLVYRMSTAAENSVSPVERILFRICRDTPEKEYCRQTDTNGSKWSGIGPIKPSKHNSRPISEEADRKSRRILDAAENEVHTFDEYGGVGPEGRYLIMQTPTRKILSYTMHLDLEHYTPPLPA